MKKIISFLFSMLALVPLRLSAQEKLKVVTTLSSYASIARAIGGELVSATSVAPPRFDPHFIEPRPSDVLRLKRADLFIHSGLDLEAWRDPLVNAAARTEIRYGGSRELDLSTGIRLLEVPTGQVSRAEGDIHMFGNPHFWLNPENGLIIARAITVKLTEIDPAHAGQYKGNLDIFLAKLEGKISGWREALAPFHGREIAGHHNGWVYLMDFAQLKLTIFLEPKAGIPPSPRHLEEVMQLIPARGITGIVRASFDAPEASETVAAKTGARVAVLASNPGELPGVDDYISMFEYDIAELLKVLSHA